MTTGGRISLIKYTMNEDARPRGKLKLASSSYLSHQIKRKETYQKRGVSLVIIENK